MSRTAVLMLTMLLAAASQARAEGDAAAGEKVFAKCKACHVIDKPTNRVGPSLMGVVGRQAGHVDGFKYSDAVPKGFVPKNKMAFAGLKDEKDRQNVIAYLKQAGAAQ